MQLEYFLVCDSFAFDGFKERVSAFNIIQEYKVEKLPFHTKELSCILSFIIDQPGIDNLKSVVVQVKTPQGDVKDFKMDFVGDDRFTCSIQRFRGIPIEKTGDLVFKIIDDNGEQLSSHTIEVKVRPEGEVDGKVF